MKYSSFALQKRIGFTLIEMLVVTTIMIIITSIGLVSFSAANRNARNAKRQSDIAQVRSALELYRSVEGNYPVYGSGAPNAAQFTALMANTEFRKYLQSAVVQDPTNTGSYVYIYSAVSGGAGYTVCYTLEPSQPSTCFSSS